jgi:hypothetical protein
LALTSVMDGFSSSNEKADDKCLELQRRKLDLKKKTENRHEKYKNEVRGQTRSA